MNAFNFSSSLKTLMASLANETLTLSFSEIIAGVTKASFPTTSFCNLSQTGLVQMTVLFNLSLDLVFDHF